MNSPAASRVPSSASSMRSWGPIEKVWRWLKQEVVHLHRQADDWQGLKAAIKKFLEQFAHYYHQLK